MVSHNSKKWRNSCTHWIWTKPSTKILHPDLGLLSFLYEKFNQPHIWIQSHIEYSDRFDLSTSRWYVIFQSHLQLCKFHSFAQMNSREVSKKKKQNNEIIIISNNSFSPIAERSQHSSAQLSSVHGELSNHRSFKCECNVRKRLFFQITFSVVVEDHRLFW